MPEQKLLTPPIPEWNYRWLAMMLLGLGLAFAGAFWIDALVTANRDGDAMPGDLRRIVDLCEIFAHGFGAALVLILVWRMLPDYRHRLRPLAAVLILPGLAVQGIKLMVARRRPLSYQTDTPGELELPGSIADTWAGFLPNGEYAYQSFPSAHAAGAVAMAIGLSWLFPRGRFLFFSLALLASFQRITSGAHWLSDVIAGAAVALLVCFIIFRMERRREAKLAQKNPSDRDQDLTTGTDQQVAAKIAA